MPWTIDWRPAAEAGLLHIHWRAASRIGAAVRTFVTSFAGDVERTEDPHVLRLRVRGAVAVLRLDPPTKTVHVMAIFAA